LNNKPIFKKVDFQGHQNRLKKSFLGSLLLKIKQLFSKKADFELNGLKDLSKYNYEELSVFIYSILSEVVITKEVIDDGNFIAIFQSKRTRLTILYSSDGRFLKRLNEEWL
jgi:hypothetical protein